MAFGSPRYTKRKLFMKMIDFIKNYMRQPSHMEMVNRELEEAKLEKLEAETAVEYAHSIVQYNTKRIDRLNTYIAEQGKEKSK
jgi:hypothetical protein